MKILSVCLQNRSIFKCLKNSYRKLVFQYINNWLLVINYLKGQCNAHLFLSKQHYGK